jgi:hypothetical protein
MAGTQMNDPGSGTEYQMACALSDARECIEKCIDPPSPTNQLPSNEAKKASKRAIFPHLQEVFSQLVSTPPDSIFHSFATRIRSTRASLRTDETKTPAPPHSQQVKALCAER